MAKKRERLEVIYDILIVIRDKPNIKPTRLLYQSNLSPQMFKEYVEELVDKEFIEVAEIKNKKSYTLTEKAYKFLQQYKVILDLVESFGL